MAHKDLKRSLMEVVSQKIADTELAFEYELGVEYQENLMKRRQDYLNQLNTRKKEGDSSQE